MVSLILQTTDQFLFYLVYPKLLKKIIYSGVVDFLKVNNLIKQQQFGFRKLHSTDHAVLLCYDKRKKNIFWPTYSRFLKSV